MQFLDFFCFKSTFVPKGLVDNMSELFQLNILVCLVARQPRSGRVIPGELGQCRGCWCSGSLRRLAINTQNNGYVGFKWILVFHEERFQLPAPSQYLSMAENKNMIMFFFTTIQHDKIKDHHDDVIKWKLFPCYWSFVWGIHRWPVNSPHKGQWRGAVMLSLTCAWINDWVNNRETGDLRRHRTHYDVIVMIVLSATVHELFNNQCYTIEKNPVKF